MNGRQINDRASLAPLLTQATTMPEVSGNTIFQLSIMLAKIALEEPAGAFEQTVYGLLGDCVRRRRPAQSRSRPMHAMHAGQLASCA